MGGSVSNRKYLATGHHILGEQKLCQCALVVQRNSSAPIAALIQSLGGDAQNIRLEC